MNLKPKGCLGCLYTEITSAGKKSRTKKFRYVAEIYINAKRYRFHSTNLKSTQYWLIEQTKIAKITKN